MNIALITDCYFPIKNGVVTSVSQLKEGLEKRGHQVIVLTPEVPDFDDKEKNIYRLPSIKLILGTDDRIGIVNQGAVNRFFKRKKIELIHTHTEFSMGNAGKRAARKLKIPHVHTTHTMWEEYRHYLFNGLFITKGIVYRFFKAFLKNVSVIVAPSIKAKKYFKKILPDKPIEVIHNGIDEHKFKSSVITDEDKINIRKQFNIASDEKIIIFVGRIGKEKRVNELFDSVAPVLRKNRNIRMIFVGEGPIYQQMIKKSKDENLDSKIIFTGFVKWDVVYKLYSIADVFVTASLSEVHPMTLIEATMCGLSVIVRRDDSYLDLVYNGVNGFIVDTDAELTEKLDSLISDDRMLADYSKASMEISKKFTAETHVDKMEYLYKRVLKSFQEKITESES